MNRREFLKTTTGSMTAAGLASLANTRPAAAAEGTSADAGGRLTGTWSFVQFQYPWQSIYCDEAVLWKPENWRAYIRQMHGVGMDTLIWGHVAFWGRPLFPTKHKGLMPPLCYLGCEDPMGVVADEADKLGMKIFYGAGLLGRASQTRPYAGLEKPWPDYWFQWHVSISEAILERYGSRPSFAGLYITTEIDYHDIHVELYEKLIKEYMRPALGQVTIAASPGNIGVEVRDLDKFPRDVERTGINVLAPQDYGGRHQNIATALELVAKQARALEKVRKPLTDIGVKLWANCELFVHESFPAGGAAWHPGPTERILKQIEMQSPLVEKLVCFQYWGVMNKHTELVNIGPPDTDRLYNDYVAYLKAKFPAKFGGL